MLGVVFIFLGSLVRLVTLYYRSIWLLQFSAILVAISGPSNMLCCSIVSA